MKSRSLSFQKKLYLSVLAMNFILLFLCVTFFYRYTINTLKQNSEDTLSSETSMLLSKWDDLLRTADNSLKELQINGELFRIARDTGSRPGDYFSANIQARSTFLSTFCDMLLSQDYRATLSYLSNDYDYVGYSNYIGISTLHGRLAVTDREALKEETDIASVFDRISYEMYLPPHEDYFFHDNTVFSVVRSMRNAYRSYGLLFMDFDISHLTEFLENFAEPENHSLAVIGEDGRLLYTSSPRTDTEQFLGGCLKARDTGREIFSSSDTELSCCKRSSLTGWTFVLSSSMAEYLRSVRQVFLLCAVLFAILFAVTAVFLYLVSSRLARPMKQLLGQLRALEPGTKMQLAPIAGSGEITSLANTIQAYLTEIYNKNEQLALARQQTLQAHYDAMEAQLNPHFLYNTLSVIGMTGLAGGNATVSDMCGELADLLRYSLSHTRQAVYLGQELANAKSYLYIMKMRFEDNLICEWDWDTSLNGIMVPKLILQPVIENCFQHGFRQGDPGILPPWRIIITSRREADRWQVTVKNNGQAFPENKIAQLNAYFSRMRAPDFLPEKTEEIRPHHGFGLENTILRLNIYYRGGASFQAYSDEDGWTSVTVGGLLNPPPQTQLL